MQNYRQAYSVALYDADTLIIRKTADHPFHEETNSQKMHIYGKDFEEVKIIDLLIRIDSPQTLSIRIIEQWDDPDKPIVREISYCGRFSIAWTAVDEP